MKFDFVPFGRIDEPSEKYTPRRKTFDITPLHSLIANIY